VVSYEITRSVFIAATVLLAGLILATLTTNIAANVVAPANAIVNLAPRTITFTAGGIITGVTLDIPVQCCQGCWKCLAALELI
jgi:NCS1 family nucleobase:cation symporter-1